VEGLDLNSTTSASPTTKEEQLRFARHHFDNLQSLIRFVDTKAGVLITVVIFLGATLIQVVKDAVSAMHASPCSVAWASGLFLLGCAGFIASFGWMLLHVQQVLKPRGATHYPRFTPGQDLMWQDHVIAYKTNTAYSSAVRCASDDVLLRNVTDQIFELCHISKEKMDAFHQARKAFWGAFCSWVAAIVFGVLILRWK
jgi:hypothetical protein